jgi:hypothetical protein
VRRRRRAAVVVVVERSKCWQVGVEETARGELCLRGGGKKTKAVQWR